MKLNERHCALCEAEGREQIGGVYIVACKQQDCGNFIAGVTETDAYVAQLKAENLEYQNVIKGLDLVIEGAEAMLLEVQKECCGLRKITNLLSAEDAMDLAPIVRIYCEYETGGMCDECDALHEKLLNYAVALGSESPVPNAGHEHHWDDAP